MDTADNRGLDDKTNTIGLQVPNPIFSGGSNCYSMRQAGNRLERACYELDRIANTIITMLEQYHRMHSTSTSTEQYDPAPEHIRRRSAGGSHAQGRG
ncbi:hypothetical protein BER2_3854 [plant metagenome]|uniref:Uncharacterized protein n=1 Tax=plant metagenome TaxID=1297885 RepID=A0A484RLA3_9ZZZZ